MHEGDRLGSAPNRHASRAEQSISAEQTARTRITQAAQTSYQKCRRLPLAASRGCPTSVMTPRRSGHAATQRRQQSPPHSMDSPMGLPMKAHNIASPALGLLTSPKTESLERRVSMESAAMVAPKNRSSANSHRHAPNKARIAEALRLRSFIGCPFATQSQTGPQQGGPAGKRKEPAPPSRPERSAR